MMQQIVSITPQRYDLMSLMLLDQGHNQRHLSEERCAQEWRDENLQRLMPNIIQFLLPRAPTSQFWIDTLNHRQSFGNGPCLDDLPMVPMPYHDANAILPLPSTPHVGFCARSSRYVESIEATSRVDIDEDEDIDGDDPTSLHD